MDVTENLIGENNRETVVYITYICRQKYKFSYVMRKKDLVVRGHRPHFVRTIDGASLPWGFHEPTSALQTFRSRRDEAIPLRRPRRADRPSSNPSETHKASSRSAVDTQIKIFAETRELASSSLTCIAFRQPPYW